MRKLTEWKRMFGIRLSLAPVELWDRWSIYRKVFVARIKNLIHKKIDWIAMIFCLFFVDRSCWEIGDPFIEMSLVREWSYLLQWKLTVWQRIFGWWLSLALVELWVWWFLYRKFFVSRMKNLIHKKFDWNWKLKLKLKLKLF